MVVSEQTESRTSASLLDRLRCGDDQHDWLEFVAKYDGLIYHWCRTQGLEDADAQDATQEVLLRLMRGLKTFHYDPRRGKFRGWLRQTTRFAVRTIHRQNARPDRAGGVVAGAEPLECVPDAKQLGDLLFERLCIEEAEAYALADANPWHAQAYRLAKAGVPRAEIAECVNQTPNAVNVALHRIVKKLRQWLNEEDNV